MIGKCDKCHEEKLIEEHHLWSKLFNNPSGKAFEVYPSRVWLCTKHHRDIENQIVIPILKKYSTKPNYISQYHLWMFVPNKLREEVIKEIVIESWRWLHEYTRKIEN